MTIEKLIEGLHEIDQEFTTGDHWDYYRCCNSDPPEEHEKECPRHKCIIETIKILEKEVK